MDIIEILTQLDLSDTEANVYLLCHKYGEISITSLSRMLGIARSTLYGIVEKLHFKTFLIAHTRTYGTSYSAVEPDDVIGMLKRKINHTQEQIHLLESYKSNFDMPLSQSKNVPKVKYYEGKEAMHIVYDKLRKAKEVCYIFDVEQAIKYTGHSLAFFANTVNKKGHSREILCYSPTALQYAKKANKTYDLVKVLPKEESRDFQSDNALIDGVCYHISFGKTILCIEITNPTFFQTQKMMFDLLWKRL